MTKRPPRPADTINLDIPTDAAERIRLEEESNRRYKDRITEVLRKFGVRLCDDPARNEIVLDALAAAMARMQYGGNR